MLKFSIAFYHLISEQMANAQLGKLSTSQFSRIPIGEFKGQLYHGGF